jgi:DNA-directed RNA polymerase specialized sigma24 family protein
MVGLIEKIIIEKDNPELNAKKSAEVISQSLKINKNTCIQYLCSYRRGFPSHRFYIRFLDLEDPLSNPPRKNQREFETEIERTAKRNLKRIPNPEETPEEIRIALRASLKELSPEEREIVLRKNQGESFRDISKDYPFCSVETSRRYYRAIKRLKYLMQDLGYDQSK